MDGFVGEASGLCVASGRALAVVDVGSADGSEGYNGIKGEEELPLASKT